MLEFNDPYAEIVALRRELQALRRIEATLGQAEAVLDGLRAKVRHIVAMVDHGTPLPQLLHAVVELREALDGGT